MNFRFHEAADEEAIAITAYYEQQRPGLGQEFAVEMKRPSDASCRSRTLGHRTTKALGFVERKDFRTESSMSATRK